MMPHVSNTSQLGITSHKRHLVITVTRLADVAPPGRDDGQHEAGHGAQSEDREGQRRAGRQPRSAPFPPHGPESVVPCITFIQDLLARTALVPAPGDLRWVSSVLGLMTTEHSFILSPTSGGTQLVQTQTYRGMFTRFPPKTISRIQASFEAINQAVRQRAEDRCP